MECCSAAHLDLLHNRRPADAFVGGKKALEMLRLDLSIEFLFICKHFLFDWAHRKEIKYPFRESQKSHEYLSILHRMRVKYVTISAHLRIYSLVCINIIKLKSKKILVKLTLCKLVFRLTYKMYAISTISFMIL